MVFSGTSPIEIDGKRTRAKGNRPTANFEQVTGTFFSATGQRLLEGRSFTIDDLERDSPSRSSTRRSRKSISAARARWAVASGPRQPMASPSSRAVADDRRCRHDRPDARTVQPARRRRDGLLRAVLLESGRADSAVLFASQFTTIVAKPRGGQRADAMAAALRRQVSKVDPNLPLYFVGTPRAQIDGFIGQNRIIATMFSIFGLVAIVLASVGMYGVMSFSVNQRRQEFGVRMALGAHTGRILKMVLTQGAIQLAIGLFLGLGLALTLATLGAAGIRNVLFGVTGRDPLTYGVVLTLVTVVSVIATLVPAHRATRVDPMIALRAE